MAIKKIKREDSDAKLLKNEIDIMRCLPYHPNICRFVGAEQDEQSISLVMEHISGANLFKVLRRFSLLEHQARFIFK